MLQKCCVYAPVDFLLKNPRSKVAVDKRNVTSDLVYSIRRQGVTRLERFYQFVTLGQNKHCCVTLPCEKKNQEGRTVRFFFFKSCTVLFLFPAANRSLN